MLEFVMNIAPAFFFLVFYVNFSMKGKEAGGAEGSIRLPRFLHRVLFPGAAYNARPLYIVLVTAVSLVCTGLVGIAGVLTFFAEGAWEERMGGYQLMIGILTLLFLASVMVAGILIALRGRFPLPARILMILGALALLAGLLRPVNFYFLGLL